MNGRPRYLTNVLLFVATCLTTTWVGVGIVHQNLSLLDVRKLIPLLPDGLPYAASLMGILLAHEMGHYVVARWHGVEASLPYFLPVPLPMVGTMGAVIVMKGNMPARNALVDWAAAGPLAGLVVAIPVLAYGLHLSPVGPMAAGAPDHLTLLEGNSLLYLSMKLAVKGAILPGGGVDVQLHPIAWAGWLGMLVTMINLMPIGQLDGGHVAAAYLGERHNRFSGWLHGLLLPMAVLTSGYVVLDLTRALPTQLALAVGWGAGAPWLLWWGLLKVMKRLSRGRYHPPVGEEPLTPGRRRLCLAMLLVFLAILVPIPLRWSA